MTQHNLITISDSVATRITPPGTHSGMDITVQNVNSSGYIYLGGEDVSDEDYGYRILPNHALSIELPGKDALYVIGSIANLKVAVLKTGLESQR